MSTLLSLPSNTILLDIETSGLNRQHDQVISIGVALSDSHQHPVLKHWFLETKEEEKNLLESFLLFLKNTQSIYTYGGRTFDYPFLLSRMESYGLDTSPFLKLKLVDMKDLLKPLGKERKLLEASLSFQRQSSAKGKDILKLYRTFEASKSPLYRDLILKHQKDELYSLLAFLELYHTLLHLDQFVCTQHRLSSKEICFSYEGNMPFRHSFSGKAFDWTMTYEKEGHLLSVSLPVVDTTLKQYLQPINNYYYIESQKQLMHKSLAQFIPAPLKRRATKEECVILKSDSYIRLYSTYKVTAPIWYDDEGFAYVTSLDFTAELLVLQLSSLLFNRKVIKPSASQKYSNT